MPNPSGNAYVLFFASYALPVASDGTAGRMRELDLIAGRARFI